MAEEFTKWDEWKKVSEWVILFIATFDERLPSGALMHHFLHWYTLEQYYLAKTYGNEIQLSTNEFHKLIDFIFAKSEDGSNDLNDDIKLIERMNPEIFPSTPRSEFITDQFQTIFGIQKSMLTCSGISKLKEHPVYGCSFIMRKIIYSPHTNEALSRRAEQQRHQLYLKPLSK